MTTSTTEPTGSWTPDLSTFAARLAVIRNRMQWNAKEAALACGFPPQSWRNWEAGKRPQDYAGVCQAIAEHTGVPANWLAFGPSPDRQAGSGATTSGWSLGTRQDEALGQLVGAAA